MAKPTRKIRSEGISSRDRKTHAVKILRLLPAALIAGLGLAAFVLVVQVSVAGVFRSSRPEVTLRLAPFDARARAELADRLASSGSASAKASALALALDAIRRDALQPQALRVVAQLAGAPNAPPKSSEAALMFQAERLSRRDYVTQTWLVRHYLARGDIPAVMRHFDIALRSSVRARPTIFPLLVETAKIPEFREQLDRTLRTKSVWSHEFAQYAVANSTDFEWAVQIASIFDPADETHRPYFQTLLNRLAESGNYELAWSVHQRVAPRPVTTGAGLTDGFDISSRLAPFDWSFTQEPDLWAAPEGSEESTTILRVAARNGQSGEVARRLVRLPPGRYQVRVRMGDLPRDLRIRPELAIGCATFKASEPLIRLRSDHPGASTAGLEAHMVVPAACAFQRITVQATGMEGSQETDAWLGDLRITPLAQ